MCTLREAFEASALGDTGCVGKGMAYQEVSIIMAKTIWYLDFKRPPPERLVTLGEVWPAAKTVGTGTTSINLTTTKQRTRRAPTWSSRQEKSIEMICS